MKNLGRLLICISVLLSFSKCKSIREGSIDYVKMKFSEMEFSIKENDSPEYIINSAGLVKQSFILAERDQLKLKVAVYEFENLETLIQRTAEIRKPCQEIPFLPCYRFGHAKSMILIIGGDNSTEEDLRSIAMEYME